MKYITLFLLSVVCSSALIIKGTGTSMLPTFPEDALLRVKFVDHNNLAVGMIVLRKDVDSPVAWTAHRLVKKTRKGWITKGDNNKTNDRTPMKRGDYQGVVELWILPEIS